MKKIGGTGAHQVPTLATRKKASVMLPPAQNNKRGRSVETPPQVTAFVHNHMAVFKSEYRNLRDLEHAERNLVENEMDREYRIMLDSMGEKNRELNQQVEYLRLTTGTEDSPETHRAKQTAREKSMAAQKTLAKISATHELAIEDMKILRLKLIEFTKTTIGKKIENNKMAAVIKTMDKYMSSLVLKTEQKTEILHDFRQKLFDLGMESSGLNRAQSQFISYKDDIVGDTGEEIHNIVQNAVEFDLDLQAKNAELAELQKELGTLSHSLNNKLESTRELQSHINKYNVLQRIYNDFVIHENSASSVGISKRTAEVEDAMSIIPKPEEISNGKNFELNTASIDLQPLIDIILLKYGYFQNVKEYLSKLYSELSEVVIQKRSEHDELVDIRMELDEDRRLLHQEMELTSRDPERVLGLMSFDLGTLSNKSATLTNESDRFQKFREELEMFNITAFFFLAEYFERTHNMLSGIGELLRKPQRELMELADQMNDQKSIMATLFKFKRSHHATQQSLPGSEEFLKNVKWSWKSVLDGRRAGVSGEGRNQNANKQSELFRNKSRGELLAIFRGRFPSHDVAAGIFADILSKELSILLTFSVSDYTKMLNELQALAMPNNRTAFYDVIAVLINQTVISFERMSSCIKTVTALLARQFTFVRSQKMETTKNLYLLQKAKITSPQTMPANARHSKFQHSFSMSPEAVASTDSPAKQFDLRKLVASAAGTSKTYRNADGSLTVTAVVEQDDLAQRRAILQDTADDKHESSFHQKQRSFMKRVIQAEIDEAIREQPKERILPRYLSEAQRRAEEGELLRGFIRTINRLPVTEQAKPAKHWRTESIELLLEATRSTTPASRYNQTRSTNIPSTISTITEDHRVIKSLLHNPVDFQNKKSPMYPRTMILPPVKKASDERSNDRTPGRGPALPSSRSAGRIGLKTPLASRRLEGAAESKAGQMPSFRKRIEGSSSPREGQESARKCIASFLNSKNLFGEATLNASSTDADQSSKMIRNPPTRLPVS